MKLTFLILALTGCVFAELRSSDNQWESFKQTYGKSYSIKIEEELRRQIFNQRLTQIAQHNEEAANGKHSYTVGVNEFSDWSAEELKLRNGFKPEMKNFQNEVESFENVNLKDLPTSVDWRTKGIVTPIKNQGQCGSCWAFAAVGSLEGQNALKTKTLTSLSEQNLVDCSWSQGDMGCLGGLPDNGYKYIISNKGIDTEKSYPYVGWPGFICSYDAKNIGATVSKYVDLPSQDESALQKAVATVGPISIGMDASHDSFQTYKSGIYNDPACNATSLDHGVTVVGYGSDGAGKDYWWVKNSWGTSWGLAGYFKLARNQNNACGVSTMASYPVV